MICFILLFSVSFAAMSSSQDTMTCSRTRDTFQLPSALPPVVELTTARVGKQGPKGEKGELGLKGSKGESPRPDSEFREQVEGEISYQINQNNVLLYSLYYVDVCSKFSGPISASLRLRTIHLLSKKYRSDGEPLAKPCSI